MPHFPGLLCSHVPGRFWFLCLIEKAKVDSTQILNRQLHGQLLWIKSSAHIYLLLDQMLWRVHHMAFRLHHVTRAIFACHIYVNTGM